MLRIPCPYCGVRDEPEFFFGGPAHVTRPADALDGRYLFPRLAMPTRLDAFRQVVSGVESMKSNLRRYL